MNNKRKTWKREDGGETLSVSMRTDLEVYERLKILAEASRRRVGEIIRICVEDHLPKLEKEIESIDSKLLVGRRMKPEGIKKRKG
jgi:hypothetical protein